MSSKLVTHLGHWPFQNLGTGPIARFFQGLEFDPAGFTGIGRGEVEVPGAAPGNPNGTFPLAYHSEEDAMWWLWRVQEWAVEVDAGNLSHVDTMPARPIGGGSTLSSEADLVICHNGIEYSIERVIGDLHFSVWFWVCRPDVVGDIQVAYNPATGRWLPKLKPEFIIFKTEVPEASFRTDIGSTPFELSIAGQTIPLEGALGGDPGVSSVGLRMTPSRYWSHGGTYDESTGELTPLGRELFRRLGMAAD